MVMKDSVRWQGVFIGVEKLGEPKVFVSLSYEMGPHGLLTFFLL